MLNPLERKSHRRLRRRSPLLLFLLLLLWSIIIGWGLALITNAQPTNQNAASSEAIGTVDSVPQRYQLGQQVYLENCATCHIG
ncbi:MAG TPA: hypothetical protein V6D09_07065, partial [Leptolyngbyaceae cyanobacterium]